MAESIASKEDETAFLTAGSEITFDILCTPCDNDGDINEAEAYCNECHEYLCKMCLRYHRKVTNTKHHTLVDKENMSSASPVSDICTERCQLHNDEIIKYYCPAHKSLICGVCLIRSHDKCAGKVFIPDEAKILTESKDFKNFQAFIETLANKSESIMKTLQSHKESSFDRRTKALHDIERFWQEMKDAINKLKAALNEQSDEMTGYCTTTMNSVVDQTITIHAEIQRISLEIKTLLRKKQHCQIFIKMKNKEAELAELQKQLDDATARCIETIRFKHNEDLRTMIQKKNALGEVFLQAPKDISATHITDIYVKSEGDASKCRITAATLLSKDRLVIVDFDNSSVKLIDTNNKKIISEHKFSEAPRGITNTSRNKFAVTLPVTKQILLMTGDDILNTDKTIKVSNQCWRIACIDEKLVVSFKDLDEVRILSMTGNVIQNFSTSSQGEKIFNDITRMSSSQFAHAIYVTDWHENRLTMLDIDGNVIAQYTDADLENPIYSTVDDNGMVFVCGCNSNNIHLLTPYCNKVKILLSEREGIKRPLCVCYCSETRKLYFGMLESNFVKAYQLS